MGLVGVYGYTEEWEQQAKRAATDIHECIVSLSSEEARKSIGYPNHSSLAATSDGTDAVARSAFGSNYPRLQHLKQKYDPNMIFNKWLSVNPSTGRSDNR